MSFISIAGSSKSRGEGDAGVQEPAVSTTCRILPNHQRARAARN